MELLRAISIHAEKDYLGSMLSRCKALFGGRAARALSTAYS
jgi:hypothetical protein